MEDGGFTFTLRNSGNFSVRVRAVTLAGEGNWTQAEALNVPSIIGKNTFTALLVCMSGIFSLFFWGERGHDNQRCIINVQLKHFCFLFCQMYHPIICVELLCMPFCQLRPLSVLLGVRERWGLCRMVGPSRNSILVG